jgi:hypothetical protein
MNIGSRAFDSSEGDVGIRAVVRLVGFADQILGVYFGVRKTIARIRIRVHSVPDRDRCRATDGDRAARTADVIAQLVECQRRGRTGSVAHKPGVRQH